MKHTLLVLISLAFCLSACHTKHSKDVNGDPQTFDDFKSLFKASSVPFKLAADSLAGKQPDSLALKPAVVARFLSDTIGNQAFGATGKRRYFPLYYFKTGEMDKTIQYLVVKVTSAAISRAYLCLMNRKGVYMNSLPVGKVSATEAQTQYFSIDNKSTIRVATEEKVDGQIAQKEEVFAAYPDGHVSLILTNSSGPISPEKAFNPIDTLPRKHKLSGDYAAGNSGVISIRDGKDAKSFLFFISFSKDKGSCVGELNGIGTFTGANKGEYKDKSSSCGITFHFSAGSVNIKEEGGCGAYRGIKCFFDGVYVKKVAAKKK